MGKEEKKGGGGGGGGVAGGRLHFLSATRCIMQRNILMLLHHDI